jgi:hypothetical protein
MVYRHTFDYFLVVLALTVIPWRYTIREIDFKIS